MAYQDQDKRQIFEDKSIADERHDEQVLVGIQPKHQLAYRIFKYLRIGAIITGVFALLLFGITFIPTFSKFISNATIKILYNKSILVLLVAAAVCLLLMLLLKLTFLKKCNFDDWLFEVSQRDLGTKVIFYTSKCLYINYDVASAKEVDKKDFVTKMSDLSIHYSYFYVNTFVDQQVIQVECTRKQPVPTKAVLNPDDDLFPNIIPVGLTINNTTQTVSPISWTLNTNNSNPNILETGPSVSFLIAGGPLSLDTIIPTTHGYKTMATIEIGDNVFDINNCPTTVVGKSDIIYSDTIYKLLLKHGNDMIEVVCSKDHRFPIVHNGTYSDIQCKDINIGDYILGNFYNYKLVKKYVVNTIPCQCILIDSPEHEFLITDKYELNWVGGEYYSYPAVYTRNTGCHIEGESIIVQDNLVKNISDI